MRGAKRDRGAECDDEGGGDRSRNECLQDGDGANKEVTQ